jgi:hypothetical protein
MSKIIEIHDDRRRIVKLCNADDKKQIAISERPMLAAEIKSGEWQPPGLDGAGKALSPTFNRANSPVQYRQLCKELLAKGFAPLSPVPLEETAVVTVK